MSQLAFTKLFANITDSSVWAENSDTKVVWITLLAMADRNGEVWASVLGLARRSNVSVEATEAALAKFMAPDPYSRTVAHEGRRIDKIDGGWLLLNYGKYRELRDQVETRERKRKWIADKRRTAKT